MPTITLTNSSDEIVQNFKKTHLNSRYPVSLETTVFDEKTSFFNFSNL